jgi:hypothetical protein
MLPQTNCIYSAAHEPRAAPGLWTASPVLAVHDGGGTVEYAGVLAAQLDDPIPVYGVEATDGPHVRLQTSALPEWGARPGSRARRRVVSNDPSMARIRVLVAETPRGSPRAARDGATPSNVRPMHRQE